MLHSEPIVVAGMEFRAQCPAKWRLPAHAGETAVPLALAVTNRTPSTARHCILDAVRIVLADKDDALLLFDGGRDGLLKRPSTVELPAGRTLTLPFPATLQRLKEGAARLLGPDGFGGFWHFDGITTGPYSLRFHYEVQTPVQPCWRGSALTAPLRVHVV